MQTAMQKVEFLSNAAHRGSNHTKTNFMNRSSSLNKDLWRLLLLEFLSALGTPKRMQISRFPQAEGTCHVRAALEGCERSAAPGAKERGGGEHRFV